MRGVSWNNENKQEGACEIIEMKRTTEAGSRDPLEEKGDVFSKPSKTYCS